MVDEWDEALQRFNDRTKKRRERAKEHDEEAQRMIREAEERRHSDDKATSEEGPG